jgi:hypothetical protein
MPWRLFGLQFDGANRESAVLVDRQRKDSRA